MYCVIRNRYPVYEYLMSSPNHMGAGISPMVPSVSFKDTDFVPAAQLASNNRLINAVITLNDLIFSIHLVAGYLPLRY